MLTPVNQLIAQINPIGNPALAPNFQSMTNGFTYINTLLPTIITIGFIIGAVVFIFIFISGTFGWITAGGDKAKLEAARNRITHAIVGLVIMLLVWFIIQLVNYILGINIGMVGFPPPAPSPPTLPSVTPPGSPPVPGVCSWDTSCVCSCPFGYEPDPTNDSCPGAPQAECSTNNCMCNPVVMCNGMVYVPGHNCYDTDGGRNYTQRGSVAEIVLPNTCQVDSCTSDQLNEAYCNASDTVAFETVICLDGCDNGACLTNNIIIPTPPPSNCDLTKVSCSGDVCVNSASRCSCDEACVGKGFAGCISNGLNEPIYNDRDIWEYDAGTDHCFNVSHAEGCSWNVYEMGGGGLCGYGVKYPSQWTYCLCQVGPTPTSTPSITYNAYSRSIPISSTGQVLWNQASGWTTFDDWCVASGHGSYAGRSEFSTSEGGTYGHGTVSQSMQCTNGYAYSRSIPISSTGQVLWNQASGWTAFTGWCSDNGHGSLAGRSEFSTSEGGTYGHGTVSQVIVCYQ